MMNRFVGTVEWDELDGSEAEYTFKRAKYRWLVKSLQEALTGECHYPMIPLSGKPRIVDAFDTVKNVKLNELIGVDYMDLVDSGGDYHDRI